MLKKRTILIGLWLVFNHSFFSQSKISGTTGSWSDPSIWIPNGVPTSSNDVTISNGHTVTLDVNASCNSLNVGTGTGSSLFLLSGNTALSLSVNLNLSIASASSFSILSSSNTTHSLILNGDIINNGNLRLYQDANSLCDVLFSKNGNQTVSGTGALTRFNAITLNMGNSINNTLEIVTPTFSASTNFLNLINGTFKFSSPGPVSIEPFRNTTAIPSTAGLWINSSNVVANTNAGITLSGLLCVSLGSLSVGNGLNEDITASGGTLVVSGGSLTLAGKYNSASAAGTFSMTSGAIKLANNGTNNTGIAPFHISASGSNFIMSGGIMLIEREGGNGSQDLGFVCTSIPSASISGGTLQIGTATTPPNQTLSIHCASTLPHLQINSANATAKIINNDLSVLNGISIVSGTLLPGNFNITLGGDWENTGTFVSGAGYVNFNSASAQFIKKAGTEVFTHLAFNGAGVKTFSSSISANGNFSISSASAVDPGSSNYSLTIKGNFTNDGSFTAHNGLVLLNGASTQSISGSGSTTFFDLYINNTFGVSVNCPGNIEGTLSLTNGTLSLNSNTLTLVSNSLTTARIAEISGTGDINGIVTVQRYIAGGATGWVFMGTALSSALSLNDWDDDIYISCPSCPDGSVPGFSSIYTYDESAPGIYDNASSYVPLSSVNDPIIHGKGYWVYLGTGSLTSNDITIDATGTVRKFNYSIPLSYNNYGSSLNDGWNLIHNPYPSAISWAALKGTTTNIDDAIYVYNPDLNSGTGGYASYVNGISSPATSAGGIADNIAMCQGFYVHSTGATSLLAQESNKVSSNTGFMKESDQTHIPLLRMALFKNNTLSDETVLYLQKGATTRFESAYDSYKMRGSDPAAPMIAVNQDSVDFQINGIPPLPGSYTLSLKATTGMSGSYRIKAIDLLNFPPGACIRLLDKLTHSLTDLTTSDYTFYLADTTQTARFDLSITFRELHVDSFVQQPTCLSPENGLISVKGKNEGPWNYVWKQNGTIIRHAKQLTGADTLKGLREGSYELHVETEAGCDHNSSYYDIIKQISPVANFSCADTVYLKELTKVHYKNSSKDYYSNFWRFDVSPFYSDSVSPAITYTASGTFSAQLICTSLSGCKDSLSKKICIIDSLPPNQAIQKVSGLILKHLGENHYILEGYFDSEKEVKVELYAPDGKLIQSFPKQATHHLQQPIFIQNFQSGIYLLRVFMNGEGYFFRLVSV